MQSQDSAQVGHARSKAQTKPSDDVLKDNASSVLSTSDAQLLLKRRKELSTVLGDIILLMTQSPAHRHVFLNELQTTLLPPLALGQCRVFAAKGVPVAAAIWACVSDEV